MTTANGEEIARDLLRGFLSRLPSDPEAHEWLWAFAPEPPGPADRYEARRGGELVAWLAGASIEDAGGITDRIVAYWDAGAPGGPRRIIDAGLPRPAASAAREWAKRSRAAHEAILAGSTTTTRRTRKP